MLTATAWPPVIAALAFVSIGLLVLGVATLLRREPNTMDQLGFYEQLQQGAGTKVSDESLVDPESVRGRMLGVAGAVASAGESATGSGVLPAASSVISPASISARPLASRPTGRAPAGGHPDAEGECPPFRGVRRAASAPGT